MGKPEQVSVLLVCANPRGTDPLRTAEEDRTLRESVQLSPNRDAIIIETLHAATVDDLRRSLLRRHFDIVHFSGHGTQTGLVFEGIGGRLIIPSSEELAALLKRHKVQAVILNACFSLAVGRLVGMGAKFTVASTGAIADPAAIEFTRGFYDAIGAGRTVDDAYDEGMSCARLKGFDLTAILLRGDETYVASEVSAPAVAGEVQRSAENEPNILAGFALDLSGSMRENILNDSYSVMSRLDSVQNALRGMSESLRERMENTKSPESFRAFVYGFGLRTPAGFADLVSLMQAAKEMDLTAEVDQRRLHHEEDARRAASQYSDLAHLARGMGFGGLVDGAAQAVKAMVVDKIASEIFSVLLSHAKVIGDSTVSARELADLWRASPSRPGLEEIEPLIFGATPMKAVATEIRERFGRIAPTDEERRFLFVVSDGEPSDGDPKQEFADIKRNNIDIISCFVTSSDIADPRVLWASPQQNWSSGARLMFDIATPIDERGALGRSLLAKGWEIEEGARLFVQVNHSAVLEEFMRAVESFGSNRVSDLLPEGR